VSEQQQEQDQQDETPAVTVQAGLATAAGSVTGPEEDED
jgi:hypothetical protein